VAAISIETEVAPNHRLELKLPNDFPEGRVRVTVETVSPSKADNSAERKEFGNRLMEIRQQAIANGLQLSTTDEILAEIRTDRGEQDNDTNIR